MDQSKKTMRHFYCRDVLWETFEQMANDFDCSIDYLVNEAMRYYARSKNYQSPGGPAVTGAQPRRRHRRPDRTRPAPTATAKSGMRRPLARAAPAAADAAAGATRRRRHGVAERAPSRAADARLRRAAHAPRRGPPRRCGTASTHAPRRCRAPSPMPQMGSAGPTLFLVYNGQRYPVTKDQFIIGRGSKTSDLPIKDGNISRKHAAVIRRNGTFYIKDLGSTNGIDYKGMRIDNKRIDEGDVFHLCDYELRFTYRTD